jgi:hypothetical protein
MDLGLGLQNIVYAAVSGQYPMSFAETPRGDLLLANGIDPLLRWQPLRQAAAPAGVAAPRTAPELGGMDVGKIAGQYVCFVRYLDADGNPSNLSPVSNAIDTGCDGFIENMTISGNVVVIRSEAHGRTTGDPIIIEGVEGEGFVQANATWNLTVIDADTFSIPLALATGSTYNQGGVWTFGVATIVYGAIPVPTDPKVVRRQILRNLAGNTDVLYVDIDTADLTTEAFSSTTTDEDLATQDFVPLTYGDDDLPFANRFGVPPAHKSVVAVHNGRAFLTADIVYNQGHVEPVFGSDQVPGVGTAWPATFAGRFLYIDGAIEPYEIAAVDVANQVLTLTVPFGDMPQRFCPYTIRAAPGERRLLYYSEPGNFEAWPPYNAVAIPEDDDEITALLVLENYLYVVERRHIHRLTFQEDPLKDGFVFRVTHRGCINHRCSVIVEDMTYMLDEAGIHAFNGETSQHISDPIQNIFQVDGVSDFQVDWTSDQKLWHAAHDPVRNIIRWFVSMIGRSELRHAICYNYRQQRFWIEEFPTAICSSCTADLTYRRSLVGTEARRVLCLAEGSYDGADETGTTRGTVTTADAASLSDTAATFASLEGAPIAIVDGTGRGQVRVIAANTSTTLYLRDPWTIVPDATSTYQVGGVSWKWQSGWFRFAEDESENPRDVELVYEPLSVPARVDMLLYYDHDPRPRVWDLTQSSDGRTLAAGSPFISFDLNTQKGYVIQRITGHSDPYALGDQYLSVALSGIQAGEPVRIHEVVVSGVGRK